VVPAGKSLWVGIVKENSWKTRKRGKEKEPKRPEEAGGGSRQSRRKRNAFIESLHRLPHFDLF
jgi:hypothetical protein